MLVPFPRYTWDFDLLHLWFLVSHHTDTPVYSRDIIEGSESTYVEWLLQDSFLSVLLSVVFVQGRPSTFLLVPHTENRTPTKVYTGVSSCCACRWTILHMSWNHILGSCARRWPTFWNLSNGSFPFSLSCSDCQQFGRWGRTVNWRLSSLTVDDSSTWRHHWRNSFFFYGGSPLLSEKTFFCLKKWWHRLYRARPCVGPVQGLQSDCPKQPHFCVFPSTR